MQRKQVADSKKEKMSVEKNKKIKNNGSPVGVGKATFHELPCFTDKRGTLSVGEFPKDILFKPMRYFLVFDVPQYQERGGHAHYNCHQFIISVRGSCELTLDDGQVRRKLNLNAPYQGVYIPPLIWGTQKSQSLDSIWLVLASSLYNPKDYINEYKKFLEIVRSKERILSIVSEE